jgi:hypothetical protein
MLDDDFNKIEAFLKAGGNTELQTFQRFEGIIDTFIANKFTDNIKEGFLTLNELIYQSYGEFDKNNSDIIKDFAITIIIIKKLLFTLKNAEEDTILSEEERNTYMTLMQMLVGAIKKEAESHFNFFKIFSEYLDGINNLFDVAD